MKEWFLFSFRRNDAHQAEPPPRRLRRCASWAAAVLAGLLIWLGNLFFPGIPSVGLDPSWQLVLNHAAGTDWVFGRDLVYTYGPWGWLTTLYYFADTFAARLTWELLFKAVAALLIVAVASTLSWPRRLGFLAAALVLPALFQDTLPMLLIAGLTLWAAHTRPCSALLCLAGALVGFLALQKFTYLLMIAGGGACVAAQLLIQRRWKHIAALASGTCGAFLLGWLAAGQPLDALPAFLRHSSVISSGYTDAMFLDETATVFWFGFASAVLFLSLVWDSPGWRNLPLALALTGFGFIAWKLGFVRADGHTLGFFFPLVFAGLAAPWINRVANWRRTALSCALTLTALTGAIVANPEIPGAADRAVRQHLVGKAKALFKLDRLYGYVDRAVADLRTENDLPTTRSVVGDSSIDQFGYEQAVILLNGFNYRPRPVFQSFLAYSEPLAELNASADRSPRAPDFTLARLQTIDRRYPAFDDAQLLPRLITDHTYVRSEKNFVLLRRNSTELPLSRTPLASGEFRLDGTEQTIPAHDRALWAVIDVRPSWLGALRRLLYKPPEVALIVRDASGAEHRFRLIVPAARSGFLLSPLLRDTADFEKLVSRRDASAVRSFRLEIPNGAAKYFHARVRFELSTVNNLVFHEPVRS
jgi:hypothetical protein